MSVLNLKFYRSKYNFSQVEVANKIGVTQSCYSLWEVGKRLPDAKQIIKLCKVFDCTPNDLFGFTGVIIITASELNDEVKS